MHSRCWFWVDPTWNFKYFLFWQKKFTLFVCLLLLRSDLGGAVSQCRRAALARHPSPAGVHARACAFACACSCACACVRACACVPLFISSWHLTSFGSVWKECVCFASVVYTPGQLMLIIFHTQLNKKHMLHILHFMRIIQVIHILTHYNRHTLTPFDKLISFFVFFCFFFLFAELAPLWGTQARAGAGHHRIGGTYHVIHVSFFSRYDLIWCAAIYRSCLTCRCFTV